MRSGGGGGGGFSPASLFAGGIAGDAWIPEREFTFTRTVGGVYEPVTTTGDAVARLTGMVNGINADQLTVAKRPSYNEGSGLSWLAFDGVDDAMASTLPATIGNGSRYIGVAALTESQGGAIAHMVHSGTPGGGVATFGLCSRINGINNLGNHYWGSQYNTGFSGLGTDVYSVNKNGSTETYRRAVTGQSAVNTRTTTTGVGSYFLFAIAGGTNEYARGRMYGTIIVEKALSDAEIASTEAYMAAKTGVTL
jgi:hypothetical protein